eukprot:s2_g51.t1
MLVRDGSFGDRRQCWRWLGCQEIPAAARHHVGRHVGDDRARRGSISGHCVVSPLLSGFSSGPERIQLEGADKPIAAAILLYMRKLAIDDQSPKPAGPTPTTSAGGNTPGSGAGPASSKDSDRVPRTLPPGVWTEQVQKHEAVSIHGRQRSFNQQRLLGAEASLAKMWHQLKVTRDFSPLPLGEIMSRRSFDATGMVNALSKRKLNKELIVDVDRDRLVAEDADDNWEPRSMLAVIDALEALRWAYILLEYGHEFDVNDLFDDFVHKARQRPQQLDNFRSYSWKLCQELRAGHTFGEAVTLVNPPRVVALLAAKARQTRSASMRSPLKDDKKQRHTWDVAKASWDDKQKPGWKKWQKPQKPGA